MKKIEAILGRDKWARIKDALADEGIQGLMATEMRDYGGPGHSQTYRGRVHTVDYVVRMKLELLVTDDEVDGVVRTIVAAAGSDDADDQRITVFDPERVLTIRPPRVDNAESLPREPAAPSILHERALALAQLQ